MTYGPQAIDGKNPDFNYLWNIARLDDKWKQVIVSFCNAIHNNKYRYEVVAKQIGCPWQFVAALHFRESSCKFDCVMHNGERIVGSGLKTRLVPKNRGPFNSWEESAIDAFLIKGFNKIKDWTIPLCLELSEKYNGLGYRSKIGDSGLIELSPYVWAYTNLHDETGKYVADGKYSKTAKEGQFGVASIYLGLIEIGEKIL